ncbi:MAG: MMPL family transporter [Fibrobacteria bacterium]|nr:MMPL family transporter [Fibrobacteria bacterium]
MRSKIYKWLAYVITKRNKTVLTVCALFTIAMIVASGRLTMKTSYSDMMPKNIPQIEEFERIIEDYSSANTVMIAVESKEKNVALMKKSAEEIAGRLKNISRVKPAEDQKLSFKQNIDLMFKEHPVAGVRYDTLPLVKRIDYRIDNDFIAEHGMMMQKPKDLVNFVDMFGSLALPDLIENINNNFEKEFVDDAENLASLDGEAEAIQGLEGMYKFVTSIGTFIDEGDTSNVAEAVRTFVTGPEYFISSDNTLLLLMLQPSVSFNEFEDAMDLGYKVVDSLEHIRSLYPELDIGASGLLILQIDETEALKKDFGWPSLFALLFILVLLIGSFRTWKNPFFSVTVLVVSIIWVAGMLGIILHYLNLMSASFGIVLIGLGIDFGIHVISGFRDGREEGLNVEDAIFQMYQKVGNGLVTGGLTTSIVFFTLALTRFKALSEMGIAIGVGVIVTMLAMMILLPALIVWDSKGYSVTGRLLRKIGLGFLVNIYVKIIELVYAFFGLPVFTWVTALFQFRFLEASGRIISRTPVAILIVVISVVTVYMSWKAGSHIEFEYDMMELEPIGIPSKIVQDKILDRFEISPDYAMLVTENEDDCRDKVRKLKKAGNRTGIIGRVDGITEFIPETKKQEKNKTIINDFKQQLEMMSIPKLFNNNDLAKLKSELVRLHQNIVEIGELSITSNGENNKVLRKCDNIVGKKDEDSKILAMVNKLEVINDNPEKLALYQTVMASVLKNKLMTMTSEENITLDNLSDDIRNRYVNKKNDKLLVTVYPKSNIWEETNLRKFHETTVKISEKITGSPAITLLFIDLVKEKGGMAILMGAIAILIFLLLDFHSLKYTMFAAIPLFVGAMWMVGFMALFGIKFNYSNFMALPLIIGIGIDDGVHILHRYKLEGKFAIPTVLRYTGRAILLTTLTTIIGFGSMGLASHRGIASMGQVLVLGVGSCFLSSAYVLPSIITIFDNIFSKRSKK